jgi:hypothetical protein
MDQQLAMAWLSLLILGRIELVLLLRVSIARMGSAVLQNEIIPGMIVPLRHGYSVGGTR